ncbi:P-loop containing nucleoside triphosphate hydrolase protein, partial [Gymnopus androsaceus JB14]
WGDDFRTEYGQLGKLLARLPSGLPVLLASATMPEEVIKDILFKVGLTPECERVAVSNAKYNVALSIRILQHPTTTYADLFSLFPTGENEEFPQTIIYVNSRTEAEQIQDFLRRHRPSHMPEDAFEFYHRNITETRKEYIQKGLQSGKLRCVIATDALGMGMDFRSIVRVVLWHEPLSFLSLIQKIGRCVRQLHDIGEAILFITKAAYRKHSVVVEAERESDDEEEAGESTDGIEIDRIAAIDREEAEVAVPQRGRKKKAQSALQARDQMFLSLFIATSKCRREPWDEFFSNQGKMLLFERRPEVRCCDNCQPDKFPVEKIQLSYPFPTRAPRTKRPSEELLNEVTVALRRWRTDVIQRDYPNQSIITGRYILDDEVIDKIAARPRIVTSIEIFRHIIPWGFGIAKYGGAIVELVSSICNLHPDPVQLAHEERERKRLIDEANKEYRETLTQAFKECYDSVHLVGTGRMVKRGPRNNQQLVEELMCQPFLALPRKNVGSFVCVQTTS